MSAIAARPRARRVAAAAVAALVVGLTWPGGSAGAAPDQVELGTAEGFAVLAYAGITNTGVTTIDGDVGSFPTASQTGFGSVVLVGGSVNQAGNGVTEIAKDDLGIAYDDARLRVPSTVVNAALGGETFVAGVYNAPTLGLTGILTLDAQDDPDARFIFQAGATLIAEVNSSILLVNGAQPCNVVWQVGSSATFKTGARFAGDVLASESITAQAGAQFDGRLLAKGGAVTLDTNRITSSDCLAVTATTTSTTAAPTTTTSTTAAGGATTSTTAAGGATTTTTAPSATTSTTAAVAPTTTTTAAPMTTTTLSAVAADSPAPGAPAAPGATPTLVVAPAAPLVPEITPGGRGVPTVTSDGSSIGTPSVTTPDSAIVGQGLPRTGASAAAITGPALLAIALGVAALAVERRLRARAL